LSFSNSSRKTIYNGLRGQFYVESQNTFLFQ